MDKDGRARRDQGVRMTTERELEQRVDALEADLKAERLKLAALMGALRAADTHTRVRALQNVLVAKKTLTHAEVRAQMQAHSEWRQLEMDHNDSPEFQAIRDLRRLLTENLEQRPREPGGEGAGETAL
jgi:hypothetical protein